MAKASKKLAMTAVQQVLRKTFDGMPIVDANADFTLVVRTADIKGAKRKDFSKCILARACARQVGATKVAFMRMFAYLELPDPKGKKRLVRFLLDKDAAAIVAAFDRGKSVRGEVTVTLRAPHPSQTLEAGRQNSKLRAERQRQALLKGEVIEKNMSNARYASKAKFNRLFVRNGTGMVHNIVKAPMKAARKKTAAA
jgi:hypothetical protein